MFPVQKHLYTGQEHLYTVQQHKFQALQQKKHLEHGKFSCIFPVLLWGLIKKVYLCSRK